MAEQKSLGALAGATEAGEPIHATAEGSPKVARATRKGTPYSIVLEDGETYEIEVSGRVQWALDRLRLAGEAGCTPIAEPGPRWSAYVHSLRELGVPIETVNQPHGGDFPGHHGRYVLRCKARRTNRGGVS